jgi:hypothetical protein
MKKYLPIALLAYILFLSCSEKSPSLSDQLKTNLISHLKKIDSVAVLDSIHIVYNVPLNEKLGRILDDSGYSIEIRNVQSQLSAAKEKNDEKGIEIYQGEINYMNKVSDSVSKSIVSADTTRELGRMISVIYVISKNQKTQLDSALFFIDSASNMLYPSLIDWSLRNAIQKLN